MGTLGVGIWMWVDPGSLNQFMGDYSFKIPAAILMAAGSVVMLTGFCGCLGAIKEIRCLLGSVSFISIISAGLDRNKKAGAKKLSILKGFQALS